MLRLPLNFGSPDSDAAGTSEDRSLSGSDKISPANDTVLTPSANTNGSEVDRSRGAAGKGGQQDGHL
ncbi:hypothetical protein D3C81_2245770 [compost metagenome]